MTHDPTRDCEHGRLKGKCDVCDLQAEAEADKTIIEYHEATIKRLTELLNNPEEHYPGNFDTPQRANALLTGLCQDAATEIERLNKALAAQPAPMQEPVAWMQEDGEHFSIWKDKYATVPLYTSPPAPQPDYAWPTIEDYEKEVGFEVNIAFRSAWAMARTTNDLFKQMGENT
jgi:hypothetical protein